MRKSALARSLTAALPGPAGQMPTFGGALGGNNAMSPVVAEYQGWLGGNIATSIQPLPRPIQDFLNGAFTPLAPIVPFPIDSPDAESGRPEPRRLTYPVGYNLPSFPGANFKMVTFANLRSYAEMTSIPRTCVEVRKKEVVGLDWDIVPTDEAHEALAGDRHYQADFKERRNLALAWWRRPDPNFLNFASWLGALLEDIFVVDALTLYLHATRVSGRGPFGSDLAALEVLDGTTIYPYLDSSGASPRPPAPAYAQYYYGVPRSEFTTVLLQSDEDRLRELGTPAQEYRGDQLLYAPYVARSWTPYGFPPVEQAILPITTSLRRQSWRLEFFTEGSIPGMFVIAPPDWTAQQIRQLQDALNALGNGDLGMKWRHVVLPGHTEPKPIKTADLSDIADSQIAEEVLMVFDIKPMELGLLPGGKSGGMSSGAANKMAQSAQKRKSLKPLVRWLEDTIFNYVIQNVWRQPDLRFRFAGVDDDEDTASKVKNFQILVTSGIMTRDEVRQQLGSEPFGLPETSAPSITTAAGIIPLTGQLPSLAATEAAQAASERGIPPKAKPAATTPLVEAPPPATESEAHPASKAARARELDQLKRYLRHGNDPATFAPRFLTAEEVEAVAARRVEKAEPRTHTGEGPKGRAETRSLMDASGTDLGRLARELYDGEIDRQQFLSEARAQLTTLYGSALRNGEFVSGPDETIPESELTWIATMTERSVADQDEYLLELADEITEVKERREEEKERTKKFLRALPSRLALLASTAYHLFERGRYRAATEGDAKRPVLITWHTSNDGAVCSLCAARDGETYTPETLPGFPGDGGFGDLCAGGMNCRCWLTYKPVEAGAEPTE